MTTRLVTFLGLGDDRKSDARERYGSGRYCLDGLVTAQTWNHDVAAATRYADLASVLVLGTEKVRRVWFEDSDVYREELRRLGFTPVVGFGPIPSGRTDEERWTIFEAITRALSPAPMRLDVQGEAGRREAQKPDTILLDITHGFRSQPFFAASAVAFARVAAESAEKADSPVPNVRILYAAWEMREPGEHGQVAPVWDMTQFIRVIEWSAAISSMMRHGRGDELERLLRDTQRAALGDRGAMARGDATGRPLPPGFQKLGSACRHFADGLATARIPDLSTRLASHLSRTIGEVKEGVCREVPPLRKPLEELQEWCRPLAAEDPVGKAGLKAGVRLARRYVQMERFLEAAVALRETITSAWCVATLAEPYPQPGLDGRAARGEFAKSRRIHERELGRRAWSEADAANPGEADLLAAYRSIGDLRNDVEHGGFNEHPRKAGVIRAALESSASKLEATIDALLASRLPWTLPPEGVPCFVNLSNHRVEGWPEEQRIAAETFGAGAALDYPTGFPLVDPEAGPEEVAALADRTVADVARMNPAVIFVSGEFTLTHAFVTRFKRLGILCVAATTRRVVAEQAQPDGSVVRTSKFEFVRWREFPG